MTVNNPPEPEPIPDHENTPESEPRPALGQGIQVELLFSEDAYAEMEKLRKKLRAEHPAEVVRCALGVLVWTIGHLESGDKILTEDRESKMTEVSFPFLDLEPQPPM